MKRISIWAYHHKWAARIVLIIAYLLLNVIGFFFGDILSENNVIIPSSVPYLLALPFFAAVIFYPSRKEKAKYQNFYRRQKTMDGILATTSFLMIIYTASFFTLSSTLPIAATKSYASTNASKPIKPFLKLKKKAENAGFILKHWKQIKANYKLLKQAYKAKMNAGQVALIILATLVAIGLLAMVIALSCNLSCSGSEAAALFVLLGGTALVVFLLIKAIKAIEKAAKRSQTTTTAA